jgi:hypothetical protein
MICPAACAPSAFANAAAKSRSAYLGSAGRRLEQLIAISRLGLQVLPVALTNAASGAETKVPP